MKNIIVTLAAAGGVAFVAEAATGMRTPARSPLTTAAGPRTIPSSPSGALAVQPSAPQPPAMNEGELRKLVVMIRGTLNGNPVNGAGLIFGTGSDRLYIATANHVVRDFALGGGEIKAEDIEVMFSWLPGEASRANLTSTFDRDLDLAVLTVPGASTLAVPALTWASLTYPEALKAGNKVVPIGFPGGTPWFIPRQPYFVSSVGSRVIRTEGELVPGHSGGVLVTEDWNIAGLVQRAGSLLGETARIDVVVEQLKQWGYQVQASFRGNVPTTSRVDQTQTGATAAADHVVEIWFAGSPHRAGLPSTRVSQRILDTARTLGYSVKPQGLTAAEFLPSLQKAAAAGTPPDIVFVDNYMHVEGGDTALGSFNGMRSDPALSARLVTVNEALKDLGSGWTFLLSGSPDRDGAAALVEELSGCSASIPTANGGDVRALQLQAEQAARAFLQCSHDAALFDPAALSGDCGDDKPVLRRVVVCRITGVTSLAFVETAVAISSPQSIGRRSVVSIHRRDGDWRVLAVSGDPVTVGETVGQWRTLEPQFKSPLGSNPPMSPAPRPSAATLLTPDGVYPAPDGGERFGNFRWTPAGSNPMAQVIEMNYGTDTRLFVVGPDVDRLSTGRLWTTRSLWRWRIWTVAADGSIAITPSRSFRN